MLPREESMTRQNFTAGFKIEVARLVVDDGYSLEKACTAMDVGLTAMRRWVQQLKMEGL